MSKYCGKCDVCDCYGDMTDEKLQKSRFFIYTPDGRSHPLKIETQKDIARYYPYIVSMASGHDGIANVWISGRCYIDEEEAEHLSWKLRDAINYYKKQKRKKLPFDEEEALDYISFISVSNIDKEIVKRVKKYGEKATLDGIHTEIAEYYRKEWYDCLIEFGYEEMMAKEIVYGWRRTIEYDKEKTKQD